jgi:hypothetical protein
MGRLGVVKDHGLHRDSKLSQDCPHFFPGLLRVYAHAQAVLPSLMPTNETSGWRNTGTRMTSNQAMSWDMLYSGVTMRMPPKRM